MDVTILVDDIVVDVEDNTLEELLVEVNIVDSVETNEDVLMLVNEDVELIVDEVDNIEDDENDGPVP